MLGQMQSDPTNLIAILAHAARWHGAQEVVTEAPEGTTRRQTYAETLDRTTRLAARLGAFGVRPGDRVGTLGWNTDRHLETWYAVSGQGAVCHTINPRLFPDQIQYIIEHAEDRLIFVDPTFVDLLAGLLPRLPNVEAVVVMTDREHMPDTSKISIPVYCYEAFLAEGDDAFDWPVLDHDAASSLCYTSGTTGHPKGVLYSHRANILHAHASCMPDVFDLSATDTILMVVPMFHANSWGLAYAGPLTGAKLVLPGPHLDGASIHRLITSERVTRAAAVPTVWSSLLAYLKDSGKAIDTLDELIVGGAAVPRSMIEAFDERHGIKVTHAWGMTEMTPIGTVNRPVRRTLGLEGDEQLDQRCKQGRVPFGVDMKLVGANGEPLPHDGASFGRLLVKGPWTISGYYKTSASALDEGWFDTGDIATIDADGFMQITDRSKDVIKSGGEWISSVQVENAAMGHAGVQLAACIGVPHAKWGERPVLLVVTDKDVTIREESMLAHLAERLAKWQLPDAIIDVEEIPLTAAGKIDKKRLRQEYRDCLLT